MSAYTITMRSLRDTTFEPVGNPTASFSVAVSLAMRTSIARQAEVRVLYGDVVEATFVAGVEVEPVASRPLMVTSRGPRAPDPVPAPVPRRQRPRRLRYGHSGARMRSGTFAH